MKYPNRYTAKFAPLEYWGDPDQTKRGFIPVQFQGEIVWARPIFQIGEFKVPTKEFVEQNRDQLAVIVEVLDDQEGKLAWSGFTYWKGATPEDTQEEYPYQKVIYSDERWEIFNNTKEDQNVFHIEHEDGTILELSRVKNEKKFRYLDEKLGHKIILDEEQTIFKDGVNDISITTTEDGIILTDNVNDSVLSITDEGAVLHDGQNETAIESSSISLGSPNGSKEPVILGAQLVKMLRTIFNALATHVHPTGVGPSGVPTNATTYQQEANKLEQLKSKVTETE